MKLHKHSTYAHFQTKLAWFVVSMADGSFLWNYRLIELTARVSKYENKKKFKYYKNNNNEYYNNIGITSYSQSLLLE